jgi:hypothetical protein
MPVSLRSHLAALAAAVCTAGIAAPASAQSEGGLYIAGYGFTFAEVADRAIAHNPGGRRFFVLALPEEADALQSNAARPLAAARDRVIAANGVVLACQRDIDEGRIDAARLVAGVVAVRGWPPRGERHHEGEEPGKLPASETALRRLRSTCS